MLSMLIPAFTNIQNALHDAVSPPMAKDTGQGDINDEFTVAFLLADINASVSGREGRKRPATVYAKVQTEPEFRAGCEAFAASRPLPSFFATPATATAAAPQPHAAQLPGCALADVGTPAVEALWPSSLALPTSPTASGASASPAAPPSPSSWNASSWNPSSWEPTPPRAVPQTQQPRPKGDVGFSSCLGTTRYISRSIAELGVGCEGMLAREWRSCAQGLDGMSYGSSYARSAGDLGCGIW